MALKTWLTEPFRLASLPVSILTVLVYGLVFASVLVTDQTPDIPKNEGGLSLRKAYEDLHKITARPHPYTSHANDDVREFLLSRLKPLVASQPYIHLSNDMTSNATFVTDRGGFYFEGTNILVKIDGTDAPAIRSQGVVFSAHYDSVSTAPGATDNGMSVVTLLQLVEYLAAPERRPRRTAVFLFNNGEEDGLNGVHMFFEHPWANLTTTFVNVEGAGAGGRPILFRTSSLAAARSFTSKNVPHPHGNVLSADAFSRGVVRSLTDFSVFAQGIPGEKDGMAGIDFAFYKNRAYYHTPYDSIPGMGRDEGRRALWAMMETVRGAGLELLNGAEIDDNGDTGVYFDVLGRTMVAFSLRTLFVWQVALLVVGPLSVLGLLAWVLLLTKHTRGHSYYEHDEEPTTWHRLKLVIARIMGWGRFWISLAITIGINVGLVAGYVNINPYVIYSKGYVVLVTFLATSFLAFTLSLALFYKLWPSPPTSQKFAVLVENYFLSWVVLVFGTIAVNRLQIGGAYLLTAWNLCAWLAATIALVEAVVRAKWTSTHGGKPDLDVVDDSEPIPDDPPTGHRFVRGVMYRPAAQRRDSQGGLEEEGEAVETDPTEITPLMQQQRRRSTGGGEYIIGVDNEPLRIDGNKKRDRVHDEYGWWIFQMLGLIPLPAMLLFQVLLIMMHALRNTMADGSSPIVVYGGLALLSLLIFVNVAPFAHQIDRTVYLSVLVILIITLSYSWTAFPFTQEAPLKLFFMQKVELGIPSSSPLTLNGDYGVVSKSPHAAPQLEVVRAETLLTGIPRYVDRIVRELPSSWDKELRYEVDKVLRPGLRTVSWESDLLPYPGGNASSSARGSLDSPHWLTFHAERLNASAARFTIQGTNARSCILYFDHPIHAFTVDGGGRAQPGYAMPRDGTSKVHLWSRTWDREFRVEVAWASGDADFAMGGRAACEWAEYASGTAGGPHARVGAQIPALEEVMSFLPLWATPTKWTIGLVEAWIPFRV